MRNLDDRERIGRVIAEKRNEAGLSTRELTGLCGISPSNINKIENGKYNVSIDILSKITNALGCEIDIREKAAR